MITSKAAFEELPQTGKTEKKKKMVGGGGGGGEKREMTNQTKKIVKRSERT